MVKITYLNGWVYEGDVISGKPHGIGKCIYSDGTYEGEWKDGFKHGKGTFKWHDGSLYEGGYRHNKQHGKGTTKRPDGISCEGEWKDGKRQSKVTFKYPDGSVMYDGEWKEGRPDGNGTLNYPNGDKYFGERSKGKKHGKGVMTYANQEIYDGEWKEDKRHGAGSFTLTNGDVISGQWINDENKTLSLLTSHKRAAKNPQDNVSNGQPPAKRPHLEELQSTNAQLRTKNEELQNQVVKKNEVVAKKDTELVSLKTMLQDESVAKDKVIAEKDEAIAKKDAELTSLKAKLKKIGRMINENDDGSSNQDDEQDGVHQFEAPKAKRPHVELDEEHTKCQICFTKFCTDTDIQDEDIRHLLPVSSESCDHYFCHGCITSQQLSIAEGRNGRVPKWIECMTCKAKTAFCPSKPRYHRLLIDFLTRAQWYAQPVEVKGEE